MYLQQVFNRTLVYNSIYNEFKLFFLTKRFELVLVNSREMYNTKDVLRKQKNI